MRKTPKPRYKIGDILVAIPYRDHHDAGYVQMKVTEAKRASTGLTWIYSDGKYEMIEWDVEHKL